MPFENSYGTKFSCGLWVYRERWRAKESQLSLASQIKEFSKPPVDLKQQINVAIQRLDVQTKTLDAAVFRFQSRDAEIFSRAVKALSERNSARANILAMELSEIRKIEKMLTQTSLALQSVSMRLNTVSEMGDLVAILNPAKSVLSSVSVEMSSILPQASEELGNIGSLLSEICTTTNQSTDIPDNSVRTSLEAEEILAEAESMAMHRLEEQLPNVDVGKPIKKLSELGV